MTFWQTLPKPFFSLAPMEEVTDTVFRQIVGSCAAPDVYLTEFTNTEGLWSQGRKMVEQRLQFTSKERPIVAQIWGTRPELFEKTAQLLGELGFDGIDINMGCPQRKIIKNGSCGGLINNPSLAGDIIQATKKGAGNLPVSVKTRIGFNHINTEEWISFLLGQGISALTVHGRTVKEMSLVPAHWDEIGKAVQIRNAIAPETVIIGNGDVRDREHGEELIKEYRVDGIMIGRGIFHNMWAFSKDTHQKDKTFDEMIKLLLTHLELFENTWGKDKHFMILRRFFKIYVSGFPDVKKLREQLMTTKNGDEVREIITNLTNRV